MSRSENREFGWPGREKMCLWNCLSERFVTGLYGAAMRDSMA